MPTSRYGQRRHSGGLPGQAGRSGPHPPTPFGAQFRYDESRLQGPHLHDGGASSILGRRRRRRSGFSGKAQSDPLHGCSRAEPHSPGNAF